MNFYKTISLVRSAASKIQKNSTKDGRAYGGRQRQRREKKTRNKHAAFLSCSCFRIFSIFLSGLFCLIASFCSCFVSVTATFFSFFFLVFLLHFFYAHHSCVCSVLRFAGSLLCCSAFATVENH